MTTTLKIAQLREHSCLLPDGSLGMTSRPITGRLCVGQHVLNALFTPRGSLSWARDRGLDVRQLEHADLSALEIRRWETAIAAEARRVDYVRTAAARLTLDEERGWLLEVPLVLTDGSTFALQVAISEAVAAFTGA